MQEVYVALIGTVGLVIVALIEKDRRASKNRWEENKADHNYVVEKIETIGKSLGRSIDRNASSLESVS